MTEGGWRGLEEGSNCEDVAVGAGAGAPGFMVGTRRFGVAVCRQTGTGHLESQATKRKQIGKLSTALPAEREQTETTSGE